MKERAARLRVLLGSRSALSRPVILGIAGTGFLLSFMFLRLIPGQSLWVTMLASGVAAAISAVVLLLARAVGDRWGWSRPRVGLVITAAIVASLIRSLVTSVFVSWLAVGKEVDSSPIGRTVAALIVTVAISLMLAASAELAAERASATTELLVEQDRLRLLVESADAELLRADIDLRRKARDLLEPTISEIRDLISGEISETAAIEVSERINEVVKDVVRPASRVLAASPLLENGEVRPASPTPVRLMTDEMDITEAIRPGWLFILSWGVMIPGPLALGVSWRIMALWMSASLVLVLLLYGIKFAWPRRMREMPIAPGLGLLLLIYLVINLGFQLVLSHLLSAVPGPTSWTTNNQAVVIVRVGLAMLVSILATLSVHGEQIRADVSDINAQLEALISRIRRETWLLHRSVSLAVHGTIQSALISTAMRLSAPNRTHEIVEDARRRLEDALTSISVDQREDSSVESALEDLQGLWQPMVTIDFEVSDSARVRVVEDSGLRTCVIEICREAVSNAIRHGHSLSVNLVIDTSDELLRIRVTDDGESSDVGSPAGLGSQMLDETCLRWSRVRRPGNGSEMAALLA